VDLKIVFTHTRAMKNIFLALFLLILAGCASSPAALFQSIAIGDEKGSVLSKLGNPERTYYKEDTHRWVYAFKDQNGAKVEKEIWFQNGRVVYFDVLKTKKSNEVKKNISFEPVE
jgi:outer membrane protein assembly factor BamE (lipoprotein component of BamABCDE complex)